MKIRQIILFFLISTNSIADNNEIKISKVQLYNLGIKLGQLKTIAHIPLLYAPAQVIIPPNQEYIVSVAQAGLVNKINATVGDTVEKGQVLAHISSPELLSLQRQFLKANSQKQLALSGFERNKKLLQEGVISNRHWQESRSHYNAFLAEADESKQLLEIIGMSAQDIKTLASSRRLSSQLKIRAPIKGVVLERMVVAGERLDMLASMFRIANLEQFWLEINIPQERMGNIKVGDRVKIETTEIVAEIVLLAQSVNKKNQTILARAVIIGSPSNLRVGQNVTAQIVQNSHQSTFIVPNVAIAQSKGQAYLFIRNATGFEVSAIKIVGKQQNNSVIIGNENLSEGLEIAIRGAVALKANWLGLGNDQ